MKSQSILFNLHYTALKKTMVSLLFTMVLASLSGFSQTQEAIKPTIDSTYVQTLLDEGYGLEISNPDSAITVYLEAADIAKTIDYKLGYGRALQYTGIVFSDQGQFDFANEYYYKSIAVFKTIPYPAGVGATYVNIGNTFQNMANYSKAIENYLEGIKIFEDIGDTNRWIVATNNLGTIFSDLHRFDKSVEYYDASLKLSRQVGDSLTVGSCYINLGVIEHRQGNNKKAQKYFEQTRVLAEDIGDEYLLHQAYDNLSRMDVEFGNFEESLKKAKRGLYYANTLGAPGLISMSEANVGISFLYLNVLDSAQIYLDQAIKLATENNAQETLIKAYQWMSELQEKKENTSEALTWYKKYAAAENETRGENQQRIINGLQIEYETEKKDSKLSEQALTIERNDALLAKRNSFIFGLIGAFLSAVLIIILIQRTRGKTKIISEQKASIQKEKIEQLKKDQQVIALKSVLEGQEQERARIARDLHDGLGGLLSTAKMRFSKIQSTNKDLKQSKDFEKAIQILDDTSVEARKISHNLMPPALVKFGLVDALRDFFDSISSTKTLHIDFQVHGLSNRLSKNLEIMIYRIFQELINNIIKHAQAKEVIVQIVCNNDILYLTVEDDGQGFDIKKTDTFGAGLNNIKSRIDSLNGHLDIDSEIGVGTTFSIELPMKTTQND